MCRNDCAHSQTKKTQPKPRNKEKPEKKTTKKTKKEKFSLQYTKTNPESGSRKRFQGSEVRAIDSSHKITPI